MFKVLTIGTATRDVFISSHLFKIVHDPMHLERLGFPTGEAQCFALGGKIEVARPVLTVGGGATNTAVTFARQGFKTEALVKIGRDKSGADVVLDMKKSNVKPLAVYDKDTGTAYSAILLSPSGERTILNYRGASENLTISDVGKSSLKADLAYIVPGHIDFKVIAYLVKKLKKLGAVIAMNPSKYYVELGVKRLTPIFRDLDVILVNREEASYLTGKKFEDEDGIFKKFDELVGGVAVMTDGPKGVLVSDGRKVYKAGIFQEKKIVDRTGAGDAFGSGFMAGLLRQVSGSKFRVSGKKTGSKILNFGGEAIKYAIRLGSANATSVVEEVGAQPGVLSKNDFEKKGRWKNLKIISYNI